MAQNESRYDVLKRLIYPSKYFGGVTKGTKIDDWSPNNLRRIFIFDNCVFVQWYVGGLNLKLPGINPFAKMKSKSTESANVVIRYAEFKSANEAVINDTNYELPAMLDLVFKSGQKDGYKLSNIEDIVLVNLSDTFSLHDGRNYNTYKLQEYTRYFGVSKLDVGSMEEFLDYLVKNNDKPLCFWNKATPITPNKGKDGKCLYDNLDNYYNSTFHTHAPGEATSGKAGVTYELDIKLRKKLEGIKKAYFDEKEGKKQEKEKETTELIIFAKKLHNILNTAVVEVSGNSPSVKKYIENFLDRGVEKIDGVEKGKLKYILAVATKILVDVGLKAGKPTSFDLLTEGDKNKVTISEDIYIKVSNQAFGVNGIYKSEYAAYEKIIELANKYKVHFDLMRCPEDILRFILFLDLILFMSCMVLNNCKVQANALAVTAINTFDKACKTDYSQNVEKLGTNSNFLYSTDANSGGNVVLIFGLVNAKKSYRYTEFITGFREKYKGKFDYDKIQDIVKDKLGVTNIKDLDTEQRDTFDGICIACAYYIMIVKYCTSDVFTDMNELSIKMRVPELLRYDIITEVVNKLGKNKVITGEILNNVSVFQKVDEGVSDPYKNKSKIHDIVASLHKLDDILV